MLCRFAWRKICSNTINYRHWFVGTSHKNNRCMKIEDFRVYVYCGHLLQIGAKVELPMANRDSLSNIVGDKLDKNNFHAWKFKMTNFLMGKGYLEYIDGDQEEAPRRYRKRTLQLQNWRHSRIGTKVHKKCCIGCLLVYKTP